MGSVNLKALLAFLILILNCFFLINAQDLFSACTSKETCAECIKEPNCGWCSQSDFHGADKQPLGRCNTTDGHIELGRYSCSPEFYFNPESEVNKTKDLPISNNKKASDDIVPMQPQEVSVKLRRGMPSTIKILYEDPQDHPLDLYFLMDLTFTMRDDKDTLAKIGDQLAASLTNITSKYRQGFGSFIDKETIPYVMTFTSKVAGCPECTKPYGFRNHLQLSNDSRRFSEEVSNAKLSASIDPPEGGLDGLMQTIVCKKEIGWGADARKLVIYASDAPFHIAGDGKLGGIIRPNDGDCHLNSNGFYTHSTQLDYPSIAQLNQRAKQNNITVIFAVTANQLDIYTKLATRIEGATVGIVSNDSSNILGLVMNEYEKILTTVEMNDNLPKKYVKVKYFSKCGDENVDEYETQLCKNLNIGSPVSFTVSLELLECPPDKNEWEQTYRIYRMGIPHGVVVKLSMLCDCPCENSEKWILKSTKCSGVGTEKCGLCDCGENHFGAYCQCNATDGIPFDETAACKAPNSKDICSQRGQCFCNQCVCNKLPDPNQKYSGKYCECDNFSCNRLNGELCSGHGECKCGKCECSAEWTGKDCSCSKSTATCIQPGETESCSGQGDCVCGNCQCKGKYSGTYCEKCKHESCPNRCDELAPCVQCKIHGTGLSPSDCEQNCSSVPTINIVELLEYDYDSDENMCIHEDETDNCKYYFSYGLNPDKSLYVNAQGGKECPFKAPVVWIVGGTAGIMLLVGIIAFCLWKIFTVVSDRREYARFQEESEGARFNATTNPLYDNPVGHYENPMYGKKIE